MTTKLYAPFTCYIAGPTGCGKTRLTMRLIEHARDMIQPPPSRIIWCYGTFQDEFNSPSLTNAGVEFKEGLPNLEEIKNCRIGEGGILMIIDDLLSETNDEIMNIFTKGSHHSNISCCFLSQNLYYGGNRNRTMNLNTHYMFIFKNPRDAAQIQVLSRQMFPQNSGYLAEAFRDATRDKPYSYLFVDLKTDTDDDMRLKTQIFPDDFPYHYVYIPKEAVES